MKKIMGLLLSVLLLSSSISVWAAPKVMSDGAVFDPQFYAQTYPDVAASVGQDENALYQHYKNNGAAEGRLPYAPGTDEGTVRAQAALYAQPVVGPGMYLAGRDIVPGEYLISATGSIPGYYEVDKDSAGTLSSIITNDNISTWGIVTIQAGQYLKLNRCNAQPRIQVPKLDTTKSGTFQVGIDIPAGEYRLVQTGTVMAYYEVTSDSSGDLWSIVANDNFENTAYVTVSDGQYLTLRRCRIAE